MIKIIVDSICDLPNEILIENDIEVLPLKVSLNNIEYKDRVDIQVEEVYDEMRKGIVPKTSQVSPADIYKVFDTYCEKGHDFIYLAFSSVLSGTCGLAENILEEFKEKYPERKMAVIDSKSGSTAIGIIALEAIRLIKMGYDFEEILTEIDRLIASIQHIFFITDLKWLVKGGRIGAVEATLGTMLEIKPIIEVRNGYLEVTKKVRGRKKAIKHLVDQLEERTKDYPEQLIAVSHADDLDGAEEVIEAIKKRLGNVEIMINKIGCVLGAHLGIGGVGILFLDKKPDYLK